ncbi:MAG TPA: ATP-binding cassette domain-containing protein, partial [Planctomycetota bacterium]|nr:ATP-binding cassette domain-containing protein [Planctomycetota bacterium]
MSVASATGPVTARGPGPLIATEHLVVGRRQPLLRDVTLQLLPGQCWFLLGQNGAGKTTLIATLLGLLPPLQGRIEQAPSIADRSGIGFVPQEQRFQQSLPVTVTEFVSLGLSHHAGRHTRSARAAAALAAMQIAHLQHRNSAELSLGQRRRMLVARALARDPALLVLDEPTANLDPVGAGRLGADLEQLRASNGMCLLHASHDVELARRHATHVALVARG